MADGKGRGKISGADKSGADWVTKLGESFREGEPPAGYKTRSELADELGVSMSTIRDRLKAMTRSGELEEVSVRVVVDGTARVTKSYGPKSP